MLRVMYIFDLNTGHVLQACHIDVCTLCYTSQRLLLYGTHAVNVGQGGCRWPEDTWERARSNPKEVWPSTI